MSDASLIFSDSPLVEDLAAEVVAENDCCYLYVHKKNFAEKTLEVFTNCWIKNHVFVPDEYDPVDDMQDGLQPKVHTKHCDFKDDLQPLQEDDLEIVWGEEGRSVGLYNKGELICAIPYWTTEDAPGYSKYSGQNDLPMFPFPLTPALAMHERMQKAKTFWAGDFQKTWKDYSGGYLGELEEKFGKHTKYFAIDGGKFPTKALALFEKDGYKYAFTIGLGMFPQPTEQRSGVEAMPFIELAFCYKNGLVFDEMKAFSNISSLAGIPWAYNTFFNHYHTAYFSINTEYNAAVFVCEQKAGIASLDFLKQQSINLLWIVPVHDSLCKKLRAKPSDYSDVDAMVKSNSLALTKF
ncbi:MAG: suppressor of fused domain protein [Spirochaetes bacterium]|nr:suppressor of fused domain protein [Spirochaetota bacterium]